MIKFSETVIANPQKTRPHVVILGAGASVATWKKCYKENKKLPVMNDFIKTIKLSKVFGDTKIDLNENFEKIYSEIKDEALKKEVEDIIRKYFEQLKLPRKLNYYDHLLLSLRNKDAICTFNWDPFLFDAYIRNQKIGINSLPEIFFLHGAVNIGACANCGKLGDKIGSCNNCQRALGEVPLLYPVMNKNYTDGHKYISEAWKSIRKIISDAFILTIFGYGAPMSDKKAKELLQTAWFNDGRNKREIEHVEIIDTKSSTDLYETWGGFTPTHHFHHRKSFEESWLTLYPRRSCEALLLSISQGIAVKRITLLNKTNLAKFQKTIHDMIQYEI